MSEEDKTVQYIILRKDLNMRKGKMVAQGAHASMKIISDRIDWLAFSYRGESLLSFKPTEEMVSWLQGLFTKIVLSVDSEEELLKVYKKANIAEIPCSLITDSGLTEFNNVPTNTAVAIGPAKKSVIEPITKDLPLL